MKIKYLKPLKYLVWLGLFLTVMGISAGVVSGAWGTLPIGLIISGLVAIAGLVADFLGRMEDSVQPKFWSRRSTQSGTNALVGTLSILVILGLINFLAVQNSIRTDLTESQLFTLAPETQQVLRELKHPVKLYVFDERQNPQDRSLLENYQRQNPSKFSFDFVNPQDNPGLAEAFGIKNSGDNRDVYLEFQPTKRRQFLQSTSDTQRISENKLTSGIVQLVSDRQTTVYFLQGHGERSLQAGEGGIFQGVEALKDKNFLSQPLNLSQTATVPASAAAVLIVGQTRPLLAAEVTSLAAYLNQGGNLLVMVDPRVTSGLEDLLNQWGVKFDDRIAINASDRQVKDWGATGIVITQYGNHPITQDFRGGISAFPFARPLEITPVSGVQATPLLLTDPKSWAESNLKAQPLKLDGGDRPGPLALGAAFTRAVVPSAQASPSPQATASPTVSPTASPQATTSPAENPSLQRTESRLVAIGNSSFINDGLFRQQLLNGDVFLNAVRWVSQQDDQPLSIRPKDVKNRRIILTTEQATVLAFIALAVFPLLGLGGAGFVWWRRR